MTKQRYNRRLLFETLSSVEGSDELGVLAICDPPLPEADVRAFQQPVKALLSDCVRGIASNLDQYVGRLGELALTAETPKDDIRWKVFRRALLHAEELYRINNIPLSGLTLGALQLVYYESRREVRVNAAIKGVLWVMLSPKLFTVGWELPASIRDEASHITILCGRIGKRSALLPLWNIDSAVVRETTAKQLIELESHSIGVSGARSRLEMLRKRWNPADDQLGDTIRSFLWEVIHEGVHPEERGTEIVERLEGVYGAGLPSRRSEKEVYPEATFRSVEGGGPNPFEDLAKMQPAHDQSPEESALEAEATDSNKKIIAALWSAASEEERSLLDILDSAWHEDPSLSIAEVARRNNLDSDDVEAVVKRLQRKAKKIS